MHFELNAREILEIIMECTTVQSRAVLFEWCLMVLQFSPGTVNLTSLVSMVFNQWPIVEIFIIEVWSLIHSHKDNNHETEFQVKMTLTAIRQVSMFIYSNTNQSYVT